MTRMQPPARRRRVLDRDEVPEREARVDGFAVGLLREVAEEPRELPVRDVDPERHLVAVLAHPHRGLDRLG